MREITVTLSWLTKVGKVGKGHCMECGKEFKEYDVIAVTGKKQCIKNQKYRCKGCYVEY